MAELASKTLPAAFTAPMSDHILLRKSQGDAAGVRKGLECAATHDPLWALQLGMKCILSVEDTLARPDIGPEWRAKFKATGESALETMLEVFPRDSTHELLPIVAFISARAKDSTHPAIQQAASTLENLYDISVAEPQSPAAPIVPAVKPPVTVLRQILPTLAAQSLQGSKGAFVAHLR